MGIADWIRRGAYSGTVDDVETQPVMLREGPFDRPAIRGAPSPQWDLLSRLARCVLGDGDVGVGVDSGGIVDAIQAIGVSLG